MNENIYDVASHAVVLSGVVLPTILDRIVKRESKKQHNDEFRHKAKRAIFPSLKCAGGWMVLIYHLNCPRLSPGPGCSKAD